MTAGATVSVSPTTTTMVGPTSLWVTMVRTGSTITTTTAHLTTWQRRQELRWATGQPAQPGAITTATGCWTFMLPVTYTSTATWLLPSPMTRRTAPVFIAVSQ